jgi:beta-hydroxylase
MIAAMSDVHPMKRRLPVRLVVFAANLLFDRILLRPSEWLVRRASSVGREPFFDPAEFGWIARLETACSTIRSELLALLRERGRIPNFHEISSYQLPITQDDRWKAFWLYAYGRKIKRNCIRCPETTRLVESIPGVKSAFFSILAPGKHIPEHRGPYAGVLRYHLGLVVPQRKEGCRIRVGPELMHWEEGRSLVFDDTYPHEVWNDTDAERIVLFVDFARPLAFPASLLNEAMIRLIARSGLVQEIVEKAARRSHPAGPGAVGDSKVAARGS